MSTNTDHARGRAKLLELGKMETAYRPQSDTIVRTCTKLDGLKDAAAETQEKIEALSEQLNSLVSIDVVVGNVSFVPDRKPIRSQSPSSETRTTTNEHDINQRTVSDDAITVVSAAGETFTMWMPIGIEHSWDVHQMLSASEVGIAGTGTVQDPKLRKSKEAICMRDERTLDALEQEVLDQQRMLGSQPCGGDEELVGMGSRQQSSVMLENTDLPAVVLPKKLRHFQFPSALARIKEELFPHLPPWEHIIAKPYKFLQYTQGDKFVPHQDTIRGNSHFGTLTLHIPTDNDDLLADDGVLAFLEEHSEYDEATKQILLKRIYADSGAVRFGLHENVDDEDGDDDESKKTYYRTKVVSLIDQYRAALLLKRKRQAEEKGIALEEFLQHVKGKKPRAYPLSYAAWLTDTPHEVLEVKPPRGIETEFACRFVVTYELHHVLRPSNDPYWSSSEIAEMQQRRFYGLRDSSGPMSLPLCPRNTVSPSLSQSRMSEARHYFEHVLVPNMKAFQKLLGYKQSLDLAVCLAHQYPFASINPTSLKGVDAAAYQALSYAFDVSFVCAAEMREGEARKPGKNIPYRWDRDSNYTFSRRIVAAKVDEAPGFQLGREELPTDDHLVGCLWLDLGLGGEVFGGGTILGNWDCGVDWYYRTGVMVVHLDREAREKRCCVARWFLREAMQRVAAVEDVVGVVLDFVC